MNKSAAFFSCFVFYFLPVTAFAQESLVKFPSGDAAWTVDVTYADSSSKNVPAKHVQKLEVARKDDVRRNQLTWSDGKNTETWRFDTLGIQIYEDPQTLAIHVISRRDTVETSLVNVAFDESLFSWITATAFKGKETYEGKECLHYEAKVAPPPTPFSSEAAPPRLYQAWIEEKTLLPVALDDGISLSSFTFQPPPTEPLVMPPELKEDFERYVRVNTPLKRPPGGN